jgi:hypothetical protein
MVDITSEDLSISDLQKSFIKDYLDQVSAKRSDLFDKRLARWSLIASLLGISGLLAIFTYLNDSIHTTASNISREVALGSSKSAVDNAIASQLGPEHLRNLFKDTVDLAIKARSETVANNAFSAETLADTRANLANSKSILSNANEIIKELAKTKQEIEEAKITIAKLSQVSSQRKDIVDALIGDANFRQEVAAATGLPRGGILAFEPVQNSSGCPAGWTAFAKAAGRTIIGAGKGPDLTERLPSSLGGAEKVKLQPENLPPHSRTYSVTGDGAHVNGGASPAVFKFGGDAGLQPRGDRQTSATGGGASFEVLPPYIALYYCIKE